MRTLAANQSTDADIRIRVNRLFPSTTRMKKAIAKGNSAMITRAEGLSSGTMFPTDTSSLPTCHTAIKPSSDRVPLLPGFLRTNEEPGGRVGERSSIKAR